jgi:hypothetical protein
MNQAEYLNLSRKRKRTTKQIDEEREKVLGKNRKEDVDRFGIVRQTWQGPTKRPETIRDRIANKLDKGHGSSGDFHKSGTKNVGMEKGYSQPKSMKHKGRSR